MAKPTKKQAKQQLEKIKYHANFSKDRSGALLLIVFFLIVVCAGLAGGLYYIWWTRPTPTYFATTPEGKIFRMESLNRPYLNQKQLYQWAVEGAVASYTFDFVNFQRDIQEAKPYYTEAGYRQLLQALSSAGTINEIQTKKLVSTAVATGAPITRSEGVRNDRYYWVLQFPMKVTYQSASEVLPQNLIVTINISRVPVSENPKGVGITSIVVREGRVI